MSKRKRIVLYKEFNNINIEDAIGVCSVNWGTKMIARYIKRLKPNSVLDVGTGTGFIPIYSTLLGSRGVGIDINPLSIDLAKRNARRNKCDTPFFISDLFEKVEERYDLIFFSPPLGGVSSVKSIKWLEFIKSLIPKDNYIIYRVVSFLTRRNHQKLIQRFLDSYSKYLTPNGQIIIFIEHSELPFFRKYRYEIVDELQDNKFRFCLLKI